MSDVRSYFQPKKRLSSSGSGGKQATSTAAAAALKRQRPTASGSVKSRTPSPAGEKCKGTVRFQIRGPVSPAKKQRKLEPTKSAELLREDEKDSNSDLNDLKKSASQRLAMLRSSKKCAQLVEALKKFQTAGNGELSGLDAGRFYANAGDSKNITSSQDAKIDKIDPLCSSVGELQKICKNSKKMPAHKKYRHLLEPRPPVHQEKSVEPRPPVHQEKPPHPLSPPSIGKFPPLPHHFHSLQQQHRHLETILKILNSRGELATLEKVRNGCRRLAAGNAPTLKEKHIAQIAAILPSEPLSQLMTLQREKVDGKETLVMLPPQTQNSDAAAAAGILQREKIVREALEQKVIQAHKTFLLEKLQLGSLPEKILRLHPQFNLEKDVPEVQPDWGKMPKKMDSDAQNSPGPAQSAASLLEKIREFQQGKNELDNTEREHTFPQIGKLTKNNQELAAKKLKGVSSSLIEKIRQREQEKTRRLLSDPDPSSSTFSPGKLRSLTSCLRNFFVTERKKAILRHVVETKMSESLKLSREETRSMLSHVIGLPTEPFQSVSLPSGVYVKINQ